MLSILGVLCLVYYAMLCMTLKKWNSTFSRFWLLAGILFVVCDLLAKRGMFPGVAWRLMLILAASFVVTECIILSGMTASAQKNCSHIIVLGAHVEGRKITDSLKRRLDKALEYLREHPDTKVIVSGGMGRGEEITEAEAMEGYLLAAGVSGSRIIKEDASTTTQENLKFSARYIGDISGDIGIVSNNFHLYRACRYAKNTGYKNPCPLAAGCHPVILVNYMVRECFAVWKMWILSLRLLTKPVTMI